MAAAPATPTRFSTTSTTARSASTTDGVRQALNTAGLLASVGGPTWLKPGNFDLEVYASEYSRAQQTPARTIALDQIGILSVQPNIRAVLNERNYGVVYDPRSDTDPYFDANGSESSARARVRIRAYTTEIEPLLERADVLAFSHMGTLRALLANLRGLSDQAMMTIAVDNGAAFLFNRTVGPDGISVWTEQPLPSPVIAKTGAGDRAATRRRRHEPALKPACTCAVIGEITL